MRRIGIFLRSVALPVCVALLLAILFRPIYLSEGQPNYLLAWICIGFPFGIRRMFLWLVPHRFDLAGTVGWHCRGCRSECDCRRYHRRLRISAPVDLWSGQHNQRHGLKLNIKKKESVHFFSLRGVEMDALFCV